MTLTETAAATAAPTGSAVGRVILLNCSSSSGKTTLALSLQRLLPELWQHLALDQFRDGLPGRARGLNSPPGSPGAQGLNVVPVDKAGARVTEIQFGTYGEAVLRGMRRSIGVLARQGVNVIVDDLLFKPEYLQDYLRVLAEFEVYFVGVRCGLAVVEQREAQRPGRFPGTATSHYREVHAHNLAYDVQVDTGIQNPTECARQVIERLATPPQAFKQAASRRTVSDTPPEAPHRDPQ